MTQPKIEMKSKSFSISLDYKKQTNIHKKLKFNSIRKNSLKNPLKLIKIIKYCTEITRQYIFISFPDEEFSIFKINCTQKTVQ